MEQLNNSIIFVLGGFLLKELFDILKQKLTKENDKRDISIEQNTAAMNDLRISITTLQVEIKHIIEKLSAIPKLEKDVNEAHAKLRAMGQGNGKE